MLWYCCAGTLLRWGWSEQQLVLKPASSTSQLDAFLVSSPVNMDCHNGSPSRPPSHSLTKQITTDEGVAVYTDEHQIITGDHSYSVKEEHYSANSERPINITDEISSTTSPHANSEQVIRQEVTNPQCSRICTGLQRLPLPLTYHSSHKSQSHPVNHDLVQLLILQDPKYRCQQLEVPQVPQPSISDGELNEESCCYADMERGPFYKRAHYVSKTICEHSIQETLQRPGNQELVLSHSITFYQSSHRYKSPQYTHTQLSALERPELYIKPFIVLEPE